MKFPSVNLFSIPKQKRDFQEIEELKVRQIKTDHNIKGAEMEALELRLESKYFAKKIKEREFIYYLRTGRFPE